MTRRRSGVGGFTLALVLLAVASAYVVAIIAVRLDQLFLPGNDVALPPALWVVPGLDTGAGADGANAPTSRINVLVLGLDRRPSEGNEPTRSDSMFVLTLDPVSKTGGVLSIPRDLWLKMPDGRGGFVEDRINTAYRYGGLDGYPGGPMRAARDAVEYNFPQITVDYTMVIDFSSFIKIIDSLGGVDVQVTEGFRYDEPVSVDDRDGVTPEFVPGLDHMSGERALYYSRYRGGPDGDLGRIRRQQQVMIAVASKLISGGALARAPSVWSRYKSSVETDIPAYRIPGLALLARQVGLDHITLRSLGEVTRPTVTDGGADVLVADPADLARVVDEVFFDSALRQEAATVEVQNATTRTGLARATADYVVKRGLSPSLVTVSSVSPVEQAQSVILSTRGKDYTAQQLAGWLGIPRSRIRGAPATPNGADIVIILGPDAKSLP